MESEGGCCGENKLIKVAIHGLSSTRASTLAGVAPAAGAKTLTQLRHFGGRGSAGRGRATAACGNCPGGLAALETLRRAPVLKNSPSPASCYLGPLGCCPSLHDHLRVAGWPRSRPGLTLVIQLLRQIGPPSRWHLHLLAVVTSRLVSSRPILFHDLSPSHPPPCLLLTSPHCSAQSDLYQLFYSRSVSQTRHQMSEPSLVRKNK